MTTGAVQLQGNVQGAPTGSRTFGPFSIPLNAAVDQTTVASLSNGNNTITVPSGATVAIIAGPNVSTGTPITTYGGTLTLKGVGADTGILLNLSYWTMVALASGVSSFVLAATGSCTVEVWFG